MQLCIVHKVRQSLKYVIWKDRKAAAKDLRLVSETNLGGDNAFEWIGVNRHHHLICRVCGSASALGEHHFEALAAALQNETGFQADLDHIALFGVCADCRSKSLPED